MFQKMSIWPMVEAEVKKIDINRIDSLATLMECGSYLSVKKHIENKIGFKLGVRGWKELYRKISYIKNYLECQPANIDEVISSNDFSIAKKKIYEYLEVKIPADNKNELSKKISRLISFFTNKNLSAYEKYELSKRKNFINSSKLEGIEISSVSSGMSLEDILNKYKTGDHG